jgi:hypothetical protein
MALLHKLIHRFRGHIPSPAECREKRRDIRHERHQRRHQGRRKTRRNDMLEQFGERRPIAGDIDDEHRLVMQTELPPRQDFNRLVERADPAGQGSKRIGPFRHDALALVHVGHDDEVAEALMGGLTMLQVHRDDAGHSSAAGQRRVGGDAHQPVAAAAVDQLDAACREARAKFAGRLAIARVGASGGAAINAKSLDLLCWLLHRATVRRILAWPSSSTEQGAIASRIGAA